MSIQINLNTDEFRALLKTVYYAALCNATDECRYRHDLPSQIDTIANLVLRKAVENGIRAEDRSYAQSHGEIAALERELEEDEEIAEVLSHHSEGIFWDELISHMVGKDLASKYGDDFALDEIPQEEQDRLFEIYEKEISANGARYLEFKNGK